MVVTVLAIWIGLEARSADRQRFAVERIKSHGGQFWYDYQFLEGSGVTSGFQELDPDRPLHGPAWLRGVLHEHYFITPVDLSIHDQKVIAEGDLKLLVDLPELEELSFSRVTLSDSDVAQLPTMMSLRRFHIEPTTRAGDNSVRNYRFLRKFPRLRELSVPFSFFANDDAAHLDDAYEMRMLVLNATEIGDNGLRQLGHMARLEGLGLARTKVTDAGLAHLSAFPNLVSLNLNETAITDAGLAHLRRLPKLSGLRLINTAVSDAGLEHLKSLTSLRRIDLIGTQISEDGAAEFLLARPNCRIQIDWDRTIPP